MGLFRRRDETVAYPFVVDELTHQRLGRPGLTALATHLWPHECQTCSRSLEATRPAVRVRTHDSFTSATLHHLACHPPRWEDLNGEPDRTDGGAAETVNFVSRVLTVPTISTRTGAEVLRPFLVVNPGLEQVLLTEDDGQWRAATTDYYAQFGLRSGGSLLHGDLAVIPNAIASLDGKGLVTVILGDLRAPWVGECSPPAATRVADLGGIALAVSTAVHPALTSVFRDLADAVQTSQVATGWVPLS